MPLFSNKTDAAVAYADPAAFAAEPLPRRWVLAREIAAILLGLASLLTLLALISAVRNLAPETNWIGTLGYTTAERLFFVFGRYIAFALPVMIGLCALHALRGGAETPSHGRGWLRGLGGLLIVIATCALLALSVNPALADARARSFQLGGLVGNILISANGLNLPQPLGRVGACLLLGTCSLIGLILFTEKLIRDLLGTTARAAVAGYQWVGDLGIFESLGALLPTRLVGAMGRAFGALGRIHLLSRVAVWFRGISFHQPASGRVFRKHSLAGSPIVELKAAERTAQRFDAPTADETDDHEYDADEATGEFENEAELNAETAHAEYGVADDADDNIEFADGDYDSDEELAAHAHFAGEAETQTEAEPGQAEGQPEGQLDLLGEFESPLDETLLRRERQRRRRNGEAPDAPAFLPKPYRLPGLDLLADPPATMYEMSEEEQQRLSQKIEQTLATFKIEVSVIEVIQGPVITRFALRVAPGVRVNKILALENELAMALKAQHVRILAPIPGQAAVGIEVPNKRANPVLLKELLGSQTFQSSKSSLSFALGKNISGEPIVCDLAQMPHLLIAGSTGSGKSVCLNSIIASMLYRNKPDRVKFIMIDPKRVELSIYQAIPHLFAPVVSENKKAAAALAWCVEQMESRYKLLAEIGVRNLDGYNALLNDKVPSKKIIGRELKFLPHIVIIIDELADLMMVAKNEVEEYIIRLAQMARAVGMHLVLATQRPSVNVITGIIKANFPSRIAFQVSSKVDSRTILDLNGAEALMGRGDMLYSPGGAKPFRIQGCFVSDAEVERLADFIRAQEKARYEKDDFEARPTPAERAKANRMGEGEGGGDEALEPALHPLLRNRAVEASDEDDDARLMHLAATGRAGMAPLTPADMDSLSDDDLYKMALRIVLESRKGSVSYIQRRLKIGYARAGRIMDIMEERGIVGPYQGSKPRDIIVDPKEYMAREFSRGT